MLQACCALIGTGVMKLRISGVAPLHDITTEVYIKRVFPVGILYAFKLATGNAAYMFLSVSFIQMLKASSPVLVYFATVIAKLETFNWLRLFNMLTICIGISIALHGEIHFDIVRSDAFYPLPF